MPKPIVDRDMPAAESKAPAPGHAPPTGSRSQGLEIPPPPEKAEANFSAAIAFYGDVVVSWESAEPIRLVRNEPLPPEFDNHYALRVTGLPGKTFMPDTGRTPVIFRLLVGTYLELNPKKREQPDYVLRMPEKKSILFAFPARSFPLARADRFVTFTMDLNQMIVSARFDLGRMTFRNATAV